MKGAAGQALEPNADGRRRHHTGSVAAEKARSVDRLRGGQGGDQGMTIVIARDLANEGIRINTILPGSWTRRCWAAQGPARRRC